MALVAFEQEFFVILDLCLALETRVKRPNTDLNSKNVGWWR